MEISSSFPLPDPEPTTFSKRPRNDNNFEHDSSLQELLTNLLAFDTPPVSPTPMNYIKNNPETNNTISYTHSGSSSNTKRARNDPHDNSTITANGGNTHRRLWVKKRSKAWWDQIDSPNFPENEFKKAFKMSKATFTIICQELESVVTKKDTMLRLAIPVRQRVAVCIYRLATGEALREVSKRFGLGISTCHKLILEVCTAIKTVLMPKFLQWPDENRSNEIKNEFESLSGIPNICGSMYTTHIPIVAPKTNVGAYFNKRHTERNQKSSYSVTVQGVVDPRGVFTDICIGWPGSMSNEQVLGKSVLYNRANSGGLIDTRIVANSCFPLMDWLLVPYSDQNLTWAKHGFNEKMESVLKVCKEAFMRLKGRWGCLQKRTEMKLEDLPVVLGACCVLHNICEMRNEGLGSREMGFEVFDDEIVPDNNVRSVSAAGVRDEIAHKLLHHARDRIGFDVIL